MFVTLRGASCGGGWACDLSCLKCASNWATRYGFGLRYVPANDMSKRSQWINTDDRDGKKLQGKVEILTHPYRVPDRGDYQG